MTRTRSCILALCWCAAAAAGPHSGTRQSGRLYTAPDPNAPGGIRAIVDRPTRPMRAVFAMNTHDMAKVYRGKVIEDGHGLLFEHLPIAKYDLMVLYENIFYEGFQLVRGRSTLTREDERSIRDILYASIPFFDTKRLHRAGGQTGDGGRARSVLQEMRKGKTLMQSAETLGLRIRSLKLCLLEDVGPAWQLLNTREIVRQEVGPEDHQDLLSHKYSEPLQGIRVTRSIKDLGRIVLP